MIQTAAPIDSIATPVEPAVATVPVRKQWRIDLAAMVVLLVVAGALRLMWIGWHSMWIDEIDSLSMSSAYPLGKLAHPDEFLPHGMNYADPFHGTMGQVVTSMLTDQHPPLYELVLRLWRQGFGLGDGVARSLSVVCGLIAIPLMWDAVRVLHNRTAAWWTAILMTVANPQIEYAQEARSYMMLMMWLAFAFALTARLIAFGPTRRRQVLLAVSMFVGMATHYYAATGLAAIIVVGLFQPLATRNAILRCGVISGVVYLALFGSYLYAQSQGYLHRMSWIADTEPGYFWPTFLRVLSLPLEWFFPFHSPAKAAAMCSIVLLILPWLLLRAQPSVLLWAIAMTFAVILPAQADVIHHLKTLTKIRFTLPAALPAYAVAAVLLAHKRGWIAHLLPATLTLGCLIAIPQAYVQFNKQDWNSLARELAATASPEEPLVFVLSGPDDDYSTRLQFGLSRYAGLWTRPMLALTRPADAALLHILRERQCFWYVTFLPPPPIENVIRDCTPTGRVMWRPYMGEAIEYRMNSAATTSATQPAQASASRTLTSASPGHESVAAAVAELAVQDAGAQQDRAQAQK